jgi:uncharacterized protein (DUF302 family)
MPETAYTGAFMTTSRNYRVVTMVLSILIASSTTAHAAEEYGIFELIHQSSGSYDETLQAVSVALESSGLTMHGQHKVRVPEQNQQAQVFILTSPDYVAAASAESPRTVSAQVLRVAVYTWGEDQQTMVNMANPVAHAMVYYANSENYAALLAGAEQAAADIRAALSELPGEAVIEQRSPTRTEKHYNKYKGDGPARMMAKFRRFEKSQLLIHETEDQDVTAMTAAAIRILEESDAADVSEPTGWEPLVQIPFGDDAVYIGISSPFLEDKMIRINSRFRSDGKSDSAPYPGTDHVAALPTEVLIIREDGQTKVLHYGQMWRMQLYFWDSGYRAFTANVGVPSAIANSIKDLLSEGLE